MVISLPFSFVAEKVTPVGKDRELPKDWHKAVKLDVLKANNKTFVSVQLWHNHRMLDGNMKTHFNRVYKLEYDELIRGKMVRQYAFVPEDVATYYLKKEPWTLAITAKALCCVRNYHKVVFGDGSKSSRSKTKTGETVSLAGTLVNIWWSANNLGKWCTEGSIYKNMICHMNLKDAADEFRSIAELQTTDELKKAMGVTSIPNSVLDIAHGVDPIKKSIWILEKRFNCRRFGCLNVDQFSTSQNFVRGFASIHLLTIVSVVGKHGLYNHVVIVWNQQIIDFETKTTYHVTVDNVNLICGPNNPFLKISRGYVILPSNAMKAAVKDKSDWCEKNLQENFGYLFMFRK